MPRVATMARPAKEGGDGTAMAAAPGGGCCSIDGDGGGEAAAYAFAVAAAAAQVIPFCKKIPYVIPCQAWITDRYSTGDSSPGQCVAINLKKSTQA